MTDEQLQQALDDPQMRELVEQMAFAKRTFKNEELLAVEPDVEGEWEKFAAKRSALPLCSAKNSPPQSRIISPTSYRVRLMRRCGL